MPFTPIHMGPGLLIKAFLQGSFSLMVFGWSQIIMDIQPLIVILTKQGHLHGFTHTFVGATLIAVISVVSGKHLSEYGLRFLKISNVENPIKISWAVASISAFIGAYSHVVLDAIMHTDVEPFYPITLVNYFNQLVSIDRLHQLCFSSAIIGAVIYYSVHWYLNKNNKKQ
jgi:membrane-bound metal-dependent hydrolase YbcI (DUF457 family)